MTTERPLARADIIAIAEEIHAQLSDKPPCQVNADELKEAINFYRNVNSFFDTTKKTIWNTFLVSMVAAILGFVGMGIWNKGGH